MLRQLYSWFMGHNIGAYGYQRSSPFITGSLGCFLPHECWGKGETSSIRYHYHEYMWNGYKWVFIRRFETETPLRRLKCGQCSGIKANGGPDE